MLVTIKHESEHNKKGLRVRGPIGPQELEKRKKGKTKKGRKTHKNNQSSVLYKFHGCNFNRPGSASKANKPDVK